MTGHDYGEAQFSSWEATSSSSGPSIGNIEGALNSHFSDDGGRGLDKPTAAYDIVADSEADTYYATHPQMTVQNVLTSNLSFWNHHSAKHYDTLYGYDTSGSMYLYVAEEWNHAETYGGTSVNPFGKHKITATEDYNAVHASPTAELVY